MISAWWLIPTFMAGAVFGVLVIALVSANGRDADGHP